VVSTVSPELRPDEPVAESSSGGEKTGEDEEVVGAVEAAQEEGEEEEEVVEDLDASMDGSRRKLYPCPYPDCNKVNFCARVYREKKPRCCFKK